MEIGLIGCGAWGHRILCELRDFGCRVFVVDPSDHACWLLHMEVRRVEGVVRSLIVAEV